MVHIVAGCNNCCFYWDWEYGNNLNNVCLHPSLENTADRLRVPLASDNTPITPDFCPLLKEDCTIKLR